VHSARINRAGLAEKRTLQLAKRPGYVTERSRTFQVREPHIADVTQECRAAPARPDQIPKWHSSLVTTAALAGQQRAAEGDHLCLDLVAAQ
jgi:hypothetical protein